MTPMEEKLTLVGALRELADAARIFGKRAKDAGERLIWAQAEVRVTEVARSLESDHVQASE